MQNIKVEWQGPASQMIFMILVQYTELPEEDDRRDMHDMHTQGKKRREHADLPLSHVKDDHCRAQRP